MGPCVGVNVADGLREGELAGFGLDRKSVV